MLTMAIRVLALAVVAEIVSGDVAVLKTTTIKRIAKQAAKKPLLVQGVTLARMTGKTKIRIPKTVMNVAVAHVVADADVNALNGRLKSQSRLTTISSMKI